MTKRIYIECDECAHLRTKSGWQMTCDAFPQGIPLGKWQFASYRPCNNGIWFEKRPEGSCANFGNRRERRED